MSTRGFPDIKKALGTQFANLLGESLIYLASRSVFVPLMLKIMNTKQKNSSTTD